MAGTQDEFVDRYGSTRRFRRGDSRRSEPVLCECGEEARLVRHEGMPIFDGNRRTFECPQCHAFTIILEYFDD